MKECSAWAGISETEGRNRERERERDVWETEAIAWLFCQAWHIISASHYLWSVCGPTCDGRRRYSHVLLK